MNTLKSATSVLEASNAILLQYERPADQSESVQKKRANYGQTYFNKFAGKPATPETSNEVLYKVRKSWADAKSQLGAYKVLTNAKKTADKNPGYYVFDEKGNSIYPEKTSAPATKKNTGVLGEMGAVAACGVSTKRPLLAVAASVIAFSSRFWRSMI